MGCPKKPDHKPMPKQLIPERCGVCEPRGECVETLFQATKRNIETLLQAISPKCGGLSPSSDRCKQTNVATETCRLVCEALKNLDSLEKLLQTRENFAKALREIEEMAGAGISESQPELKRFRIIEESLSLLRTHLDMDYAGIWLFKDGQKLAVHESGKLHSNADKSIVSEQIDLAVSLTDAGGFIHLCPSNSEEGGVDAVLVFRNLDGAPIGCLLLDDHETPKNIAAEKITEITEIFFDQLHSIIREEETLLARKELAEALRTIEVYALELENTRHDRLTGLYRKEFGLAQFELGIERARRNKTVTSLLIFDIDKFKEVNDVHSHKIGDDVLKSIGEVLRNGYESDIASYHPRKTDLTCRWGGEEFVILLENTPVKGAIILAEKIASAIRDCSFKGADGKFFHVNITSGISEVRPEELSDMKTGSEAVDVLFVRSDTTLYYGKLKPEGRNCTETYVRGLEAPVEGFKKAAKLRKDARELSDLVARHLNNKDDARSEMERLTAEADILETEAIRLAKILHEEFRPIDRDAA